MGGNTELINVVYLDNMTLELYHRLLDKHPNATTYRITYANGQAVLHIFQACYCFMHKEALTAAR